MYHNSRLVRQLTAGLMLLVLCQWFSTAVAYCDDCPTDASPIATDRPGATNSSQVIPRGSIQAENGIDWTTQHGADGFDASNTRLRFGVARCAEFFIDAPNYVYSASVNQPSGFADVALGLKHQLPVPLGFHLLMAAGLGFPSGSAAIVGHGYQPYIQFPWSHHLGADWEVGGMFTVRWFPSEPEQNPTFAPTLSLQRHLGPSIDLFTDYVADYDHQRPTHVLDGCGEWRFTKTQQVDFQAGFGLNSSSVDHFFGIGYSLRLDQMFGGFVANP